MCTDILVFDKQNKQDDFQYMARVVEVIISWLMVRKFCLIIILKI